MHTLIIVAAIAAIVIETSSNPDGWSRPIAVNLVKDNVSLADGLKAGTAVDIEGFIDGRSWSKDDQSPVRYFTDLNVRALLVIEDGKTATSQQQAATPAATATAQTADDLDMPF